MLVLFLTKYSKPRGREVSDAGILQYFWLVGKEDDDRKDMPTIPDKLKRHMQEHKPKPELEDLRKSGTEIEVGGGLHDAAERDTIVANAGYVSRLGQRGMVERQAVANVLCAR